MCNNIELLSLVLYYGVWLQNPRMEQPLADVYFLVVMEHTMGEQIADMRFETVLDRISDVNKVG